MPRESIESYIPRMKRAPQFQRLGIEPVWCPGEGDIEGFIKDEVVRQGHDWRLRNDGGYRVDAMMAAWLYALDNRERRPGFDDIVRLGKLVEPQDNFHGLRDHGVWIAGRSGTPVAYLEPLVKLLAGRTKVIAPLEGRSEDSTPVNGHTVEGFVLELKTIVTADDWYLAYEWIHPFADGNGRSGKTLHNWLLGTLEDPVLIRDWYGGGNP